MFQVGAAGKMESAIDNRSMLGENLAPIGQELGVIMLPYLMGFQTRPEINMHAVRILTLWPGSASRRLRLGAWLHRAGQGEQEQRAQYPRGSGPDVISSARQSSLPRGGLNDIISKCKLFSRPLQYLTGQSVYMGGWKMC
jgi:hypothetical protein